MTRIRSRLMFLSAVALPLALASPPVAQLAGAAPAAHGMVNCAQGRTICTEVQDSEEAFGQGVYVGHDEPSLLFYSNARGSGSRMSYQLTLPRDPSPSGNPRTDGKSYNFQLHPAFWFGMAVCDNQSFPEPLYRHVDDSTCIPNSDRNIKNGTDPTKPDFMGNHPGVAFMEMQFYPPGWAMWPPGVSCDAHSWCAALNIDSLSEDPVSGLVQNSTCQARTGIEYVNFAFITRNGTPVGPPNPVDATNLTFDPTPNNPNHNNVLFMGSGDKITVGLHDTEHGLRIGLDDATTGQSGFMVASADNNFGMVKFDPTGTSCKNIPFDFHPMYSTSSESTRVIWAAHSYNIAFADEIGHFDFCGNVTAQFGCSGTEGKAGTIERSDSEDSVCLPASMSPLVAASGCIGTNSGFDGMAYQNVWPDGKSNHPTPIQFTSPLLSGGRSYDRAAFEADLPRIEAQDVSPFNNCIRSTGAGCVNPPLTDDNAPATFYPFFSAATTSRADGKCVGWIIGNHISADPGNPNASVFTLNDYGRNQQYGALYLSTYLSFGGVGCPTLTRFNNFHNGLSSNPC